jgi:hypothetical protein
MFTAVQEVLQCHITWLALVTVVTLTEQVEPGLFLWAFSQFSRTASPPVGHLSFRGPDLTGFSLPCCFQRLGHSTAMYEVEQKFGGLEAVIRALNAQPFLTQVRRYSDQLHSWSVRLRNTPTLLFIWLIAMKLLPYLNNVGVGRELYTLM